MRETDQSRQLRCRSKRHQVLAPDLNPIEQVFAKLGVLLRRAAERTVEAL